MIHKIINFRNKEELEQQHLHASGPNSYATLPRRRTPYFARWLCIRFLWFYASIAGPINMPNCFVGPPSTSSYSPDHYMDHKNCCTNKIKSLQDHHGTHYLNLQDKLCCLSGQHYYDNCWAHEWDGRITERFLLEVTLSPTQQTGRSNSFPARVLENWTPKRAQSIVVFTQWSIAQLLFKLIVCLPA